MNSWGCGRKVFASRWITCPFLCCRRRRRCPAKSKRANRGGPRGGSKARKLTSNFDWLEQLLDVFRLQEHAGINLFPWASWWKRKCMCLHCWNPLNTTLKMGVQAVAEDRIFSTSVISNGWMCYWFLGIVSPDGSLRNDYLMGTLLRSRAGKSCSKWPL